jgi:branched-chain amino acid transport system ATP-binding protein
MPEAALASRAPAPASAPLLVVEDLHAWYGESHVLHGIRFDVRPGEVVTLLGRNGAGKTTTLKSIIGIIAKRTGSIVFDGKETIRLPSRAIARLGVGYVPEERGIFSSLSVEENLDLPPQVKPGASRRQDLRAVPTLRERLSKPGHQALGGGAADAAIGRILRTGAKLLLLDEPSEGLRPVIVQQIGCHHRRLKADGFSIVLSKGNFRYRIDGRRPPLRRGAGAGLDMIPTRRTRIGMSNCTPISACGRQQTESTPRKRP